eukprot:scaffold17233_cov87-Cylindrotheca_fusiformis.AAC.1
MGRMCLTGVAGGRGSGVGWEVARVPLGRGVGSGEGVRRPLQSRILLDRAETALASTCVDVAGVARGG